MLKAIGKKLFTVGGATQAILTGLDVTSGYSENRQEGHGFLYSAAASAADAAMWYIAPWAYGTAQVATGALSYGIDGYMALNNYGRQLGRQNSNQAFVNSHFDDTKQTYTMRQRGMQIAQRSQYNVQQAMLGNEAKYMMK